MSDASSPHDPQLPAGWTEAGLACLLVKFFAGEIHRGDRESMVMLAADRGAVSRGTTAARWTVPWAAAAVLLCGGILSWSVWRIGPRQVVKSQPVTVEIEATGIPFQVELVSYRGSGGTFEQRNEWRETTAGNYDPRTGDWVEWSSAELAIEVESIDGSGGVSSEQDL